MTDYHVDPDDVYDPQIQRLAEWSDSTPEAVLSRILDDSIPSFYKQTKEQVEQAQNQREQVARDAAREEVQEVQEVGEDSSAV